MRRTARFLLYTLRPCLLILPISVTSAVLLLPRIAGGTDGPVAALCNALPSFGLLFLLMQGVNLAISALPLALSLGGRRRDLLLGVQLCALLGAGAAVLPWLLPLPAPEAILNSLWPCGLLPLVLYLGLAILAVLLGCLSGLLMRRSRLSGGLLYSAGLLLLILLWPACRLILASPAVWGALPLFLLLSLPVSAALLEFLLFRALARLSVR
ncbi:MAG: hypothetical protein KH028_04960 [Oscillospiraceae bacterium]|jgi:hypothetical protein|nr:hypothetical protein [Oscillospiraceae bacterium]